MHFFLFQTLFSIQTSKTEIFKAAKQVAEMHGSL